MKFAKSCQRCFSRLKRVRPYMHHISGRYPTHAHTYIYTHIRTRTRRYYGIVLPTRSGYIDTGWCVWASARDVTHRVTKICLLVDGQTSWQLIQKRHYHLYAYRRTWCCCSRRRFPVYIYSRPVYIHSLYVYVCGRKSERASVHRFSPILSPAYDYPRSSSVLPATLSPSFNSDPETTSTSGLSSLRPEVEREGRSLTTLIRPTPLIPRLRTESLSYVPTTSNYDESDITWKRKYLSRSVSVGANLFRSFQTYKSFLPTTICI